jgi:hypothetical protein
MFRFIPKYSPAAAPGLSAPVLGPVLAPFMAAFLAPFLPWQESAAAPAPQTAPPQEAADWTVPSYLRRQRSGDSVHHTRLHGRMHGRLPGRMHGATPAQPDGRTQAGRGGSE